MPELPEVEVLARYLREVLPGRVVRDVIVRRERVLRPTTPTELHEALQGARIVAVRRRAKFLLFDYVPARGRGTDTRVMIGHLGMTGRMFIRPEGEAWPRHAAVILQLDQGQFVFEDTRYFGRLTLEAAMLEGLGPEPLDDNFTAETLRTGLQRFTQAVKVKLLDQSLLAGVGNIYASEALHRAGISPRRAARRLRPAEIVALWRAIRTVLYEAIEQGSTLPLDWAGAAGRDRLFYYGLAEDATDYYAERLQVYDREGKPCHQCGAAIRRIVQAARSTFYCPACQK